MKYFNVQSDEMTRLLNNAPVYKKFTTVHTFRTLEHVVVRTVVNGYFETENIAQPGDYIITNPDGEQYVLKPENFHSRYKQNQNLAYPAPGLIRAVRNPSGEEISILAPWGETQHGAADCFIAGVIQNVEDYVDNQRYIIENKAFFNTYRIFAM